MEIFMGFVGDVEDDGEDRLSRTAGSTCHERARDRAIASSDRVAPPFLISIGCDP